MEAFEAGPLSAVLASNGFAEVLCRPMNLRLLTDALQRKGRRLRRLARSLLTRCHVLAPLTEPLPNLVYIGKKGDA